jgi:tetratricopeptide (TPR) repeat protein
MHTSLIVATVLALTAGTAAAQTSVERERARPHVRTAWDSMRVEAWPEAAKAFQAAIGIDAQYEDAYYGLGLANMRMKKYGAAIAAYIRCRDLYRSMAGKQFSSRQEAQRYRQNRLTEIDEIIRQYQTGPQSASTQDRLRQLQQQRREIEDYIARGSSNMTVENSVPAFVHLALGSAYFRTEQFPDAEREYKAAIAVEPKSGETFNNLAALYLHTGRYKEAETAMQSAEKAGFRVHPQLKQDIKNKLDQ